METVAFPKESDIANKPNKKPDLVQMVPLCQIALDPHLCLSGTMETVAFPKESDIATKPSQMVPLCQISFKATTETVAFPKESDIATKPNLFKWSHSVKLLDPHLCLIGYDGNGGISKRE